MKESKYHSNRILIIDDNIDIHEDFRKILQTQEEHLQELKKALFGEEESRVLLPEYEIDSAYQGEEGLSFIEQSLKESKPYFIVFVDHRMPPGWNGIETIEKIWKLDPDIQTVICTAYSDYSWQDLIRKLGFSDRLLILKKPFDSIEVRQLTCAMDEKWQLGQQSRYQIDILQSMVDERTSEIRGTLEATTDGILVVSQFSKILDYNQNFQNIWKDLTLNNEDMESILSRKEPQELISFISSNILEDKNVKTTLENLIFNFEQNNFVDLRLEFRLKNSKIVELFTRPLKLKQDVIGRVLSFRDITEQRYFEEQLSFQATHDLLTRLPNRMLLVDRLQQGILQAKRNNTLIAVIFLDLDRFKFVNDSLGHNFGDELLKAVSERLLRCMRDSDTLCRVGGDEFIIMIGGLKEENHSLFTIKKLQETIKEPFVVNGHQLTLSCSMGISFFPKNGQDADDLLKNADAAMYRAKSLGKNNFQFYAEEMNVQMRERLDMEQNLYLAYKLGELLLYYQPIVDAKTQKIARTEALLRWQHPQLGLIPPQKFIGVAEETGLILPIGEWALRTACEQNLYWKKCGLPFLPISLNISSYQVKNIKSIEMILEVLDEMGYDGKFMMLELTENSLMEISDEVKTVFHALQNKGICFLIDDFGKGYSNLNYLMHYPISKIKIDKSFIDNLETNHLDADLIKAIIAMSHSLNKGVVAEGVETEKQYKFLLENHCDEIQGFYFSKPVSAQEYALLLKKGQFEKADSALI